MTRRDRYARSEFAPWPDEGLREAARELQGYVGIRRTDMRHDDPKVLVMDVADEHFHSSSGTLEPGRGWLPDPLRHDRLLRLTWENWWEGHIHHSNRIFALESYDEFYAGPIFAAKRGYDEARAVSGPFVEIVSDPDPWIEQILEQNGNVDIFPPSGEPVMMSERARAQNPHLSETGRFFPSNARLSDSGTSTDFIWTASTVPTAQEKADFEAEVQRREQERLRQMLAKPRYRHLLIISGSHFVEILCEDLPRWEWVTVTEDAD